MLGIFPPSELLTWHNSNYSYYNKHQDKKEPWRKQICGSKFITGTGGFCPNVPLLIGKISLAWSSKGSWSYPPLCHQTAPFPSIVPLPLIVSPTSFVNSSHCRMPDPQWLEPVGATMVPSNCGILTNTWCQSQIQSISSSIVPFQEICYLKNNVVLTVWTRKWDGPHQEHIFFWDINDWSLNLTSCSPGSLKCLKKERFPAFLKFSEIEIRKRLWKYFDSGTHF